MTRSRSAIDPIRGYYYQFDYFILKILECNSNKDAVAIESVEDIDLTTADETTAIQCKFYSKTEYNHSVIASALCYMMKHYLNKSNDRIKYKIYGFYKKGSEKLESPLTLDFFKENFMSLSDLKEVKVDDAEILGFLNVLTIDNNAQDFDEQEKSIINIIKNTFACNDFDAEFYYYNNALRIVRELAINQDVEKRTITKGDFMHRINNKDILFNNWYLKKKGEKMYGDFVKKEFFTKFNTSPFERFFLIEYDCTATNEYIKNILIDISIKWSKNLQRDKTAFCPYVYFHGIPPEILNKVMSDLQNDGLIFIDGYDFKDASFSVKSILKKSNYHNCIKLKIIHEKNMLDLILRSANMTCKIYQFFTTEIFYHSYVDSMHSHVKIPIDKLTCVNNIII